MYVKVWETDRNYGLVVRGRCHKCRREAVTDVTSVEQKVLR